MAKAAHDVVKCLLPPTSPGNRHPNNPPGIGADGEADLVKSFLGAYSKGVTDYNSTMIDKASGEDGVNAMVDLIHKYVYTDRPREKAAPGIINGTMRLNEGAALNMASVEDQLKWFQSEGLVDAGITMDMLVDASYVETV